MQIGSNRTYAKFTFQRLIFKAINAYIWLDENESSQLEYLSFKTLNITLDPAHCRTDYPQVTGCKRRRPSSERM